VTIRVPRWGLYAVALLLAALAGAAVTLFLTAGEPAALPSDCRTAAEEPERVVLACGDGNFWAEQLNWRGWGDASAEAAGMAASNTCEPSCAEGAFRFYPVRLVASELRECAGGRRQYTRVEYEFTAESPYPPDSPRAADPTVPFPCSEVSF